MCGKRNRVSSQVSIPSQKFKQETRFLRVGDGVKLGWFTLPRAWRSMNKDRRLIYPLMDYDRVCPFGDRRYWSAFVAMGL